MRRVGPGLDPYDIVGLTPIMLWALDPYETDGPWGPMRRVSWTPIMLWALGPYKTGVLDPFDVVFPEPL